MKTAFLALALVLLPAAALADEAIATGAGAPPATAAIADPLPVDDGPAPGPADDGARLSGEKAPARTACAAPADRKPHGQVWGAVGTGGYRSMGAVVTQPIGDCASVTVAVSRTEGGGLRARGRR